MSDGLGLKFDFTKEFSSFYTFSMRVIHLLVWCQLLTLFSAVGAVLASDLPACPSSGYFHNCFGTYTFAPDSEWAGDKYVGEFRDGTFHGQGTYTFAEGDKYVGEHKDGKPNGQGTFYSLSDDDFKGDKYVGEFKDGKKHGQGTYTFASGSKYVGEYKDDKPNGQGTYIFANGRRDVGEYKDGALNGYAIQYRPDGSIIKEGIFKDDEFLYAAKDPSRSDLPACPSSGYFHNCFGTHTFAPESEWAGDEYAGEFRDNTFHGQGTYHYANGAKYVGEFKEGKSSGQGTHTFAPDSKWAGDKYVGEFRDDVFNGQGTYTYASGDKYIGEYRDGKKHGQGTYTFANGDKYVGEFRDADFNGRGTYTYANGRRDVGEFKDGVLNGYAIQYRPDGSIIKEGIFKDDEFLYAAKDPSRSDLPACPSSGFFHNCFGTYTFAPDSEWAGDKYVGEFRDDDFNGQGTYTFANGDKHTGEYRDGKPNGQGTYTYVDGDKYVGEFRDDDFNGQGTFYYLADDDFKGDKYSGEYKDGKPDGQGTYTFADGRRDVGAFKDGVLNGYAIQYRADGSIIREGIFKDDVFLYAQKTTPANPAVNIPNESDEIITASSGSGFAVSSDGHVITNYHVVDGCEKVVVHTKENDFPVRMITYDPKNDLALLKGDFSPKTVFALSNSSPQLLQDVYVAGFPFGDKVSTSIKVTKGIVSSLTGLGNNFSNIQIDAALQSGNSGGPILDDFGNVVGVAVAKLDSKYMFDEFGIIPENTNFGVKSSVVRSVLESNNVKISNANKSSISKSQLGEMIANGTYYISCWMTLAQIEEMKSKKVFFNNLD